MLCRPDKRAPIATNLAVKILLRTSQSSQPSLGSSATSDERTSTPFNNAEDWKVLIRYSGAGVLRFRISGFLTASVGRKSPLKILLQGGSRAVFARSSVLLPTSLLLPQEGPKIVGESINVFLRVQQHRAATLTGTSLCHKMARSKERFVRKFPKRPVQLELSG